LVGAALVPTKTTHLVVWITPTSGAIGFSDDPHQVYQFPDRHGIAYSIRIDRLVMTTLPRS
jgi:hypothetical protein